MADIRAAVIDTHALLLHAAEDRRLGTRASRHLQSADLGQAIVHVPMAVVWEVAVLVRSGRIALALPAREFFACLFANAAYQPYALSLDQIYAAADLDFTKDPFDALIVAAAQALSLPLLTRDRLIHDSGVVDVMW